MIKNIENYQKIALKNIEFFFLVFWPFLAKKFVIENTVIYPLFDPFPTSQIQKKQKNGPLHPLQRHQI